MEDKISQSFKVQWLNDTLKFIRNDNLLTMDYPRMPIAHVEYFYNSINQREDNSGLGFRSLFSPLWEAMAASSEKFEFKISISRTESNDIGQLIIQKTPKNISDDQNKCVQNSNKTIPSLRSPKLKELLKQVAVKTVPKNTNPIDKPLIKQENKKAVKNEPRIENCENSFGELKLNETIRNKPKKKTKSQKYFEQTKKIIDSIAPAFFKTIFTKIYEFLNDVNSGSVTFSDLAPNEALFLQNFTGVYNRRAVLDIMFSPFCNDLLGKMAALFKEFDKQSKLDICVGKTDVRTSKREITFLKVPRYTKITSTKAKLTNHKNADLQCTADSRADDSGNKLLTAISKTTDLTNDINKSVVKSDSVTNTIDKKDLDKNIEFELSTTKKDTIKSIVFTNTKIQTNNVENDENYLETLNNMKNLNINERNNIESVNLTEIEKNDVNGIDNKKITDNISTKSKKVTEKDADSKKIKIDSAESIDAKSIKITVSNKKLLNTDDNNDKVRSVFLKDNIKKPIRKGILFEKPNPGTDNESVPDENIDTVTKGVNRNRHSKIFEAMSTPLESDIAMRMMRLMGWEGGALGVRGEGITEPIIPALNITPGAGLGHVSSKSSKSVKNQEKVENRLQFLHAILDLLTNADTESQLSFDNDITKKEKRAFRDIICVVNNKRKLNLSKPGESEVCENINDKMADDDVQLKVTYHSGKIKLEKTNIMDTKEIYEIKTEKKIKLTPAQSQTNTNTIKLPVKKSDFQLFILQKVIHFITEDDNRTLDLRFDDILRAEHRNFMYKVCKSVNKRGPLSHRNLIYFDLYEDFAQYFDLRYGDDFQSLTIEKVDEYLELTKINSKMKEKNRSKSETKVNLNKTSLDSIVIVNEHNDKDKKNIATDKKDNNNNCHTKLVQSKKDASSSAISKKNKCFIILIEIENGKNGKEIFKLLINKINQEINFLPYLKSHGIQNGYLVYSCYNKKSCLWLKNVLNEHLENKFIEYGGSENKFILRMKIGIKIKFKKILSMLEMYNPGLNCMEWELWRPFYEKSMDFLIQVDYDSFDYVRNSYFKLNAGFDDIAFNIFIPAD